MYKPSIGLEIHVELKTESKMFCACQNAFGDAPNTHCCPVCLGLPGALPTVNAQAVRLAIAAGLSFHCEIQPVSAFDRKQYFYPDLPKAYQITQFFQPICLGGYFELSGGAKVRIREMHLEEDAGKLLHTERGLQMDFNRCGVPLLEIVTEPDFHVASQAREFLSSLREILVALQVTDGRMQEGSMRADVNISLSDCESGGLGERIELKNVSGFRAVEHGIEYEIARQTNVLASGGKISRETRRWDEQARCSQVMRAKESLPDYRYFPEPDLPLLSVSTQVIEQVRVSLPKLPGQLREDMQKTYGLSEKEALFLMNHPALQRYFEDAYALFPDVRALVSWLIGDWLFYARERAQTKMNASDDAAEAPDMDSLAAQYLPPLPEFVELLGFLKEEKISRSAAKMALIACIETGARVKDTISQKDLWQTEISPDDIDAFIGELLAQHPQEIALYRQGKKNIIAFFMGQLLRQFPRENPKRIKERLTRLIDG